MQCQLLSVARPPPPICDANSFTSILSHNIPRISIRALPCCAASRGAIPDMQHNCFRGAAECTIRGSTPSVPFGASGSLTQLNAAMPVLCGSLPHGLMACNMHLPLKEWGGWGGHRIETAHEVPFRCMELKDEFLRDKCVEDMHKASKTWVVSDKLFNPQCGWIE